MNRIAGSETEVAIRDIRRRYVPMLSTLAAILLGSILPIVASSPWMPNLGFLVLITWRLMRPEIWPAQAAIGFGLALDSLDNLVGVRDYWLDWIAAAAAIAFHTLGVWYIALLMGSETRFWIMIPQLVLSILAYPVAARLVLGLDRWRLMR